ncbi:DUF3429 domain-containing protein [Planctobacterium marinum]|uniref:DUF3429 domain-containing protein n=1 Tax=Planctobacterium marinum TaxID=1631968 RepID=A0AA48KPU5_9ALTE|nr:hypothetical protein MACH26_25570 [Planctobacterium marinum]
MMTKHMNFLGAAGLIPFAGLPLLVLMQLVSVYEGVAWFTIYSALILSFLGGIHWYDALNRTSSVSQLYIAMLPSITAFTVLLFTQGATTLILLKVSFLALLFYDFRQLQMNAHYLRLRTLLTGVVIGCHIAMLWLS